MNSCIPGKICGVVTMTDISKDAMEMADYNARLNKINNRCIFSCGDLFDAVDDFVRGDGDRHP